jgi:hypothetical protein
MRLDGMVGKERLVRMIRVIHLGTAAVPSPHREMGCLDAASNPFAEMIDAYPSTVSKRAVAGSPMLVVRSCVSPGWGLAVEPNASRISQSWPLGIAGAEVVAVP